MLLASEGSTTTLLDALLGESLRLRLDEVRTGRGREAPNAARTALHLTDTTPVLVRRSALVTVAGLVVSRNLVVARGPFDGPMGRVLTGAEPIGRTMNGSRDGHSRTLLEAGWSTWESGDGQLTCAFKAYVMSEGGRRQVYVEERFNPRCIPADPHAVPPAVVPRQVVPGQRGRRSR
ncbi:MAG: hypothetical protein ACRDT6_08545 [Micromonosporaceae bacterium]